MRTTWTKTTVSALVLALVWSTSSFSQSTLTQLLDNGPTDRRINIVFLAEGYTAGAGAQFLADADSMTQYMLSVTPMAEYRSYYNSFAIFVASAESGSDHPFSSIYRDTYFSSSYDSYGLQRLITIPPNEYDGNWANGAQKVYSLLAAHVPDYDIVVLIVNDPEYGGSGGSFAISSVHQASPEVVVHELGHSFANLGDEYESEWDDAPASEEANTTKETNRELIKWNDWILPSTPIPTPEVSTYNSVVGLFEGAHYHATGWYRPMLNCKMRSLGPDFCHVCRQEMVKSEYLFLAPIESYFPLLTTLSLTGTEAVTLEVVTLIPDAFPLLVEWYVDDIPTGETGNQFEATAPELTDGTHVVRADVRDTTSFVLVDPGQLLFDSRSWTIEVTDAGCCFGRRGNANNDVLDNINISDVTFLVDYLFGIPTGPSPV